MGEFVEHSLESLLPTFEQLSYVQLFTENEVNVFIKRCRQFEYRLNKHEKTSRDFTLYADYLRDFLTLLKVRRAKMHYWHKKKLIDGPLRKKVASVYRRAADRFQGDFCLWEKLINFLKENSMRRELAAAYTRALQIYGKNEELRRDFALWLFFCAASPHNARTQILGSLRLLPHSPVLYTAFLTIEIHFVEKIIKRRKFLTEKKGEVNEAENDPDRVYDEEADDAVMNLDVAKAVVEQALSSVPGDVASGMLLEMWKECNKVDMVSNIEKVRSFIVEELRKFDNEDTRLFEIESAGSIGATKFDLFEEALKKTYTERMHRLYLQWLLESNSEDAFVGSKIRSIYCKICDGGWMTEKDWRDLENIMHSAPDEFDVHFILRCLEKRPASSVMWNIYLEKCTEEPSMSWNDFRAYCNRALEKVNPDDSFPIWQQAIDHSITHAPNETEQVFMDALRYSNVNVASKIKILFVDYLNGLFNEGLLTAVRLREKVTELVNTKPNSSEFYCALYRKEVERPSPDHAFAGFVIKSALIDPDSVSVEAVILYAEWALAYDPATFHVVHQTGLKLLKGASLDEFMVRWTKLVQGASCESNQYDSNKTKEQDVAETLESENFTVLSTGVECGLTKSIQKVKKRRKQKLKKLKVTNKSPLSQEQSQSKELIV